MDGLLERSTQQQSAKTFASRYNPTRVVVKGDPATLDKYPAEDVDFAYGGAYSIYNWELFFHLPLLVATRLSQNQRFDEARRWFHFIFDPTDTSDDETPRRYWRTKPFFEQSQPDVAAQRIDRIITALAQGVVDPELQGEVDEWRRNPFKPHAIARLRLGAYMKNVLMRYWDNELAAGDFDFRSPTLESVNRAEQRYVTVEQLLGPSREGSSRGRSPKSRPSTRSIPNSRRSRTSSSISSTSSAPRAPTASSPIRARRRFRFRGSSTSAYRRTRSCWPTGTRSANGSTTCGTARTSKAQRSSTGCGSRGSTRRSWFALQPPASTSRRRSATRPHPCRPIGSPRSPPGPTSSSTTSRRWASRCWVRSSARTRRGSRSSGRATPSPSRTLSKR